jgi:hypothetical protein
MKRQTLVVGALVLLLCIGFLVLVSRPDASMMTRVQRDLARDVARFTPENSVDVAMAMKMLTHEPPRMLAAPAPPPPQLLYPPSDDTLARMCGV